MKEKVIVSDFDGTITKKDTLYAFLLENAPNNEVNRIGQEWEIGNINSQECIIQEFNLIPNINEEMINRFIDKIELDEGFIYFNKQRIKANIDFVIVSDGLDYFINKILDKYNLNNFEVITNHAEFKKGKFEITFPNNSNSCKINAGTCKCKAIENLKKNYKTIYYCGDGVSDYCVANKADKTFAKSKLAKYCAKNNIAYKEFSNFKDIWDELNYVLL